MFNQLAPKENDEPLVGFTKPLRGDELLNSICVRLDRELPSGPYLLDRDFAKVLGLTVKTLCNVRKSREGQYPVPFKLANCRDPKHVRYEVVRWLAREEMTARSKTVHRCR